MGTSREDITDFTSVDRTREPDFFRRFLDEGNKVPGIVASKPIILDGLKLATGHHVLDLGCGLGDDTFAIEAIVGPTGGATGVDISETMIDEARRRAKERNSAANFEVGDSQKLRFEAAKFDSCRTERMLMHTPDAEAALSEMARVVKSGGRVSVFDFDWETQFVDSPFKETTRLITRSFCDNFKNGWIGRTLPRLFKKYALTDVTIIPQTILINYPFLELLLGGHVARLIAAGGARKEEVDAWWTHLRGAHQRGEFIYGFTALIVSGAKRA
jgi:ubiquinone/menaquinone biosynthesis C-methylase UbiE